MKREEPHKGICRQCKSEAKIIAIGRCLHCLKNPYRGPKK